MKKIKNLLLPIVTITSATALVAPLMTSCNEAPWVADSEISMGYTPTIGKHAKVEASSPEAAIATYIKDIKNNPTIMSEDYKYSVGQIYSLVDEIIEDYYSANSEEETPEIEIKVDSLKAGLNGLSFNEDGLFSYNTSVRTSLEARISGYYEDEEETEQEYRIQIITDNLGFETDFVNFDTFDISREDSILDYGYTAIRPVFPLDLSREDWSLRFRLFGGLQVKINDEEIVNTDSINVDWTFDYQNSFTLSLLGSSVIEILQKCGSFASWYMSDVTCVHRLYEKNDGIVELTKNNDYGYWEGNILLANPRRILPDVLKAEPRGYTLSGETYYHDVSNPVVAGLDLTTLKSRVIIDDLKDYGPYVTNNELWFALFKYREDSTSSEQSYTYQWRERHAVKPRFNQDMTYTNTEGVFTGYASAEDNFYNPGCLCAFEIQLTYEGDEPQISENDVFSIKKYKTALLSDYLTFTNVKITVDGEEFTDFEVKNNKQIVFTSDIEKPTEEEETKTIRIELTNTGSLEDGYKAYSTLVAGA